MPVMPSTARPSAARSGAPVPLASGKTAPLLRDHIAPKGSGEDPEGDLLRPGAGHVLLRRLAQVDAEVDPAAIRVGKADEPGVDHDALRLAQAGLAVDGELPRLRVRKPHHLPQGLPRLLRIRGVRAKDPLQDLHLLHGGDPQRGFDPEPGQGGVLVVGVLPALPVREVAVPVGEAVQLRLHGLLPDFVDHFPKIPDAGGAERVREADVPVPIRVPEGFPAPRARGVLRVDPPGLQADQGGENLEGGAGGAPRLRQIRIVDFIAVRRGVVQDGGPVPRAEELGPIHFLENGRGGGALRGRRRLRRARGVLRKRRGLRRLQGRF